MQNLKTMLLFHSLLLGLFCCNIPDNRSSQKLYRYYDIFTLKGMDEISSRKDYPYVAIDDKADSIAITYFVDAVTQYNTTFQKKNGYFFRTYSQDYGKSTLANEEYVREKDITILQYNFTVGQDLSSISILSDTTLMTYVLDSPINRKISLDTALEYIKYKKMFSISKTSFSIGKDSVHVLNDFKNIRMPELSETVTTTFKNCGQHLDEWLIFPWHSFDASFIYSNDKLREAKLYVCH
jgi:hypothetical protein